MSNTLYLDETLTGFEREFAIESAKTDIAFQKLDALYEAVDANLQANYKEAELKVYSENGTYEDLAMLYTEAEKEAAGKQRSILGSVFKLIRDLCTTIKNFIVNIFKKKVQKSPSDEFEVNEEEYNTLKSTKSFGDMVKGGLANIKNSSKTTLEKLRDNIKKHKIFAAVAGIGVAAAGAAAGAAIHRTKKVKKSEVLALTDQATSTMTVIDDATGKIEAIITVTNLTATATAAATANSSSDAGKAVNDTANSIIDKIPVLREICDFIRKILAKIRDAIKNLFAKRDAVSGTVIDPNKKPDTPEKNPAGTVNDPNKKPDTPEKNSALSTGEALYGTVIDKKPDTPEKHPALGAGRVYGTVVDPNEKLDAPEKNPALGAGKDNGLPAPKPQLSAGSSEEPETIKLSAADIEKLVDKFDSKLTSKKKRGAKKRKFAELLRNSTNWKTDPAVQEYLSNYKITLESVYDLFENAIVADHFMTFYAEACDDYDYSIDNIFDSI